MVSAAWRGFTDEIARWREAGREVERGWRDDDAARPTPALERLLALAADSGAPLALAVVPEAADPGMLSHLGPGVCVLQHGTDHRNRAAPGEKKTEFSASEPPKEALARLAAGRARLESLANGRVLAVLAPPWNRLPAWLAPYLPAAGYRGLSTFGARQAARPVAGLAQINTHVDLIAWKGGRGFVGEAEALAVAVRHLAARRGGSADADEPTGWLTHHAVHDEAAWRFLDRLFEVTKRTAGVRWRGAGDLFPGARTP
jgi:hypothetical protein